MDKRRFIQCLTGASLGLAAGLLPAVASAAGGPLTPQAGAAPRRRPVIPNVPLVTHQGQVVRFYDDLVKGHTVLINFMYVACGDICPGMTANLRRVQSELGDRVGKDIFMYSVTLEPEHDTPLLLKAYADLFKVGPGWTFLTGAKDDIEQLRRGLGFYEADPVLDRDRTQHTGAVKYGYEPLGRWGMAPAMGNPKYIAEYVRWIEPNGRRPNLREMIG